MDPTANMSEAYRLAFHSIEFGPETIDQDRLAELVIAFVEWRSNGGHPPDWEKVRQVRRPK